SGRRDNGRVETGNGRVETGTESGGRSRVERATESGDGHAGRVETGAVPAAVAVSMADTGMTSSFPAAPGAGHPSPFEALSDVSNDSSHNGRDCDSQETAMSERLSQPPPSLFTASTTLTAPSIVTSSPGHTGPDVPRDKSPSTFINKSKKNEYRGLHARIEGITRQFTVLDNELKQLNQGTDKYK
ncbi:hypothetical protein KUCAC02_022762, partial [Chaenocephalus aceratus]